MNTNQPKLESEAFICKATGSFPANKCPGHGATRLNSRLLATSCPELLSLANQLGLLFRGLLPGNCLRGLATLVRRRPIKKHKDL